MANGADIKTFAATHNMVVLSIAELVDHKIRVSGGGEFMKSDDYSCSMKCVANTYLPTMWGRFRALGFERPTEGKLETRCSAYHGRHHVRHSSRQNSLSVLNRRGFWITAMRLRRATELGHASYRQRRLRDRDL